MSDDGTAWDDEGFSERPFGGRPYGGRPFGGRPYGGRPYGGRDEEDRPFGGRPYGGRPYGGRDAEDRPFGGRPYGGRPFGGRPYGGRPFGGRPFGGRPFGGRPYGGRPYGGRAVLDPDEWSADVAELVCQRSAVIRLGATLVSDEYELRVPVIDSTPGAPDYVEEGKEKPRLERREPELRLWPRDHELAAKVVLPDRVARDIAGDPLLALAVKEDLAEALALRADRAFLSGAPPGPVGIAGLVKAVGGAAGPLATGRAVLTAIRNVNPFRAPGWVLHPATLDLLSQSPPRPGDTTTLDRYRGLLCIDGADGGEFLGYPFIVSAAAVDGGTRRLYFSADWRQAWIGVDGDLVDIEISSEVHFQTDETVIRAVMAHDFGLARAEAFTWVAEESFETSGGEPAAARKRRRSSG